jgi:hypothetical protein
LRERTLLFAVPREHRDDFGALLAAYDANRIGVRLVAYAGARPDAAGLARDCDRADAVMIAGPARYAPRTVLPGPFLTDGAGRTIPAAWLPIRSRATNRRFAAAAARVQRRARRARTVAVLAQWHPMYLRLADRIQALLEKPIRTYRWTGDVIARDDVTGALGAGLAMAVYVGHGRPTGWVGYYGLRARHLASFGGEPLGCLLSLCCRTASRWRTGLSYAEAQPLLGVTAASFGAVTSTRHTDNTRWALRICQRLGNGVETVGELLVASAPPDAAACAPYRLIGDPMAPLSAGSHGARRAAAVPPYP